MPYKKAPLKPCQHCQKPFPPNFGARYCSQECKLAASQKRYLAGRSTYGNCPTCSTPVYHPNQKFCSHGCDPNSREKQALKEVVRLCGPEVLDEAATLKRLFDAQRS